MRVDEPCVRGLCVQALMCWRSGGATANVCDVMMMCVGGRRSKEGGSRQRRRLGLVQGARACDVTTHETTPMMPSPCFSHGWSSGACVCVVFVKIEACACVVVTKLMTRRTVMSARCMYVCGVDVVRLMTRRTAMRVRTSSRACPASKPYCR